MQTLPKHQIDIEVSKFHKTKSNLPFLTTSTSPLRTLDGKKSCTTLDIQKPGEIMGSTTNLNSVTISPSKAVSPSLRTLAMAPESEKGTGANATTTVSGSAPALGGANIRRLQVGGLLASLGDEWFNVFVPGKKKQWLETNKKHTKKNKTWK